MFVTLQLLPPTEVKVLPGETSPPFTTSAQYRIQAEFDHLPFPAPQIFVTFSAEEIFEAKVINRPRVNVDLISNFDFPKGDFFRGRAWNNALTIKVQVPTREA